MDTVTTIYKRLYPVARGEKASKEFLAWRLEFIKEAHKRLKAKR